MEQEQPEAIGRRARAWFAGVSLAFMFGLIVSTTFWGSSSNTLHASAQSWAFSIAGGILAGLGFGAMREIVAAWLKR